MFASPDDSVINIYAPNEHRAREDFFGQVQDAVRASAERMLVIGDFNCVLDRTRDRITNGQWATGKSESAQLDALVTDWRLVDVFRLPATTPRRRSTKEHSRTGTKDMAQG